MRYFTYNGDRLETSLFGLSFRAGRTTAVDPEKVDPKHIAKLAGNPEFSEAAGPDQGTETAPVEPKTEAAQSNENADIEQIESDEIEALRQEADTLGLKVDMRWKLPRLRREVEAARG